VAEQLDTLVVGAGPAGLAVGKALRERDIPFVIVEREQTLAPAWHRHYERLHLHTSKRFSSLPGLRFPGDAPTYPSRLQVIDYLTAYAARFELTPRLGVTMQRIEPDAANGGWHVRTDHGDIAAKRVVLATGLNAVPMQPHWPGIEHYTGELLHSSSYANGARWRDRRVLVVGAGNSGAEIALDLLEQGARSELCVRGKLHVTRRDTLGLPTPVPTIDVGTLARIKRGDIVVRKGIERFDAHGVTFVDGARADYDAVVLATGYRCGLERWLDGAEELLDERGRALNDGIAPRPGLYLVGYATPATGLLREIGFSARRVAEHVARIRGQD
jgi:indole-3-pyruvate monooxygenase